MTARWEFHPSTRDILGVQRPRLLIDIGNWRNASESTTIAINCMYHFAPFDAVLLDQYRLPLVGSDFRSARSSEQRMVDTPKTCPVMGEEERMECKESQKHSGAPTLEVLFQTGMVLYPPWLQSPSSALTIRPGCQL